MILGDNTYYVTSSTSDCLQPCHPQPYYITNTATYFTSNAIFIFMEGEHLLDSKGSNSVQVVINNAENLTLRGVKDNPNTSATITCSSNTHGLVFNNSNGITIYDISITGCGQQEISPLWFNNTMSLYIHHIILYNNGGGLHIHCVTNTDITITSSIFTCTNNTAIETGGLYIYSDIHTHM